MTLLRLDHVFHAFDGHTVVRDVSLTAESGELTCLLGPSGCGKTTLLRITAGLERLQQGRVTLDDRVVADAGTSIDLPAEARGIGMMFQDYALFPHLTLYDNIVFGIPTRRGDRRKWVGQALDQTGLSSLANSYPHMLSGGQQQRAALLRALAPEPRVLLLDEPFSGLDITLRIQVREEILGFLKQTGVTTLMVTHDPEEAMFMADRVLVMDAGRILQAATPPEIYFNPVNGYVAELFGPINRIPATVVSGAVETPIGRFEAADLSDGTSAQVLIRPEGISLTVTEQDSHRSNTVTVLSARILGRSTSLRLRCRNGANDIELHARIPGVFLPEAGSPVVVGVNPRQAFVFPSR
ncbi:MAG: ATP-binding cassette domain-containing protein [Deltaproteobacteria bacterium]|nr:ATP-binding cassette domain-containing protein [Deltaproteobacteria bacterium]